MKKNLTLLIVLSICIFFVLGAVAGAMTSAAGAEKQEETSSGETAEPPPPATTTVTTTTVATTTTSTTTMTTTTTTTTKPSGQYAEAQIVWDALIEHGLSPVVASGIMGNIMAEVGGQTLDFSNWEYWSRGTHYGICQWGGGRKNTLLTKFGPDLEAQVKFLLYELEKEMNAYGYLYQSGFGYDEFIQMSNVEQAALAFAKSYERCSSRYYNIRKTNAKKAYNYFMQ